MAKSLGLLALGIFLVFMGCRSMTSSQTEEVEHLYQGETRTITCVDGEPADEENVQLETAMAQCADAHSGQTSTNRLVVFFGVVLAGWGVAEMRKTAT